MTENMKTPQCTALDAIKSKPALKNAVAALEGLYASEQSGKKSDCQIAYDIQRSRHFADANCAPDGVSYFRNICLSLANRIIDSASIKSHHIQPTEETLNWGGFLGGTNCVWTDGDHEQAAENMVVATIQKAAA